MSDVLEQLRERAKELGIKSVHLYKNMDKLQAVIEDKERSLKKAEVREAKQEAQEKENAKKEPFKFEVVSGKLFYKGDCYRKGETVETYEDLSAMTILKKV